MRTAKVFWMQGRGVVIGATVIAMLGLGAFAWRAGIPGGEAQTLAAAEQAARAKGRVSITEDPGADGAHHNVWLTDLKTGRRIMLADKASAAVWRGTILRSPPGSNVPSSGYLVLVSTAPAADRPLYDVVMVRFSDMRRIVVAREVASLDKPVMPDDDTLRATIWDRTGQGREMVFDLARGTSASRGDVDLPPVPVRPVDRDSAESAGTHPHGYAIY